MGELKNNGIDIQKIVSPVHFWFYCFTLNINLHRARTPDDPLNKFFWHPIISVCGLSRGSWVLPDYFLQDGAEYDKWKGPKSVAYHIFPDFGHWLFKYVQQEDHKGGTFISFYSDQGQRPWKVLENSDLVSNSASTRGLTLRSSWRWEETLQMLWRSKKEPEARKSPPKGSAVVSIFWFNDRELESYFQNFARTAERWLRIQKQQLSK